MFVCWDNFAEVILQVPYFEGVMLQVRVVLISARTKGRKRVQGVRKMFVQKMGRRVEKSCRDIYVKSGSVIVKNGPNNVIQVDFLKYMSGKDGSQQKSYGCDSRGQFYI